MKKIIYTIFIAILLFACNDSYLDKLPKTSLTEETAFLSYDNYRSFMYPCYNLFTNSYIYTNMADYAAASTGNGEFAAGMQTRKGLAQNKWAYGTLTSTTSSDAWNFEYIRRINIMLSHLGDGVLSDVEAKHWKAVGYFFHSWWYMEMVHRFGDVPWVTTVINDSSPEMFNPREDRKIVADSIFNRLKWAEENIGSSEKDGDNAIHQDAIRAALSRFTLREGTWRKYHNLGDSEKYLNECVRVSKVLMDKYPTLYYGTDIAPGTGYAEMWTTENLTSIPGVIFFKQYLPNIVQHRSSDYEHIAANPIDIPQHVVDLFLCNDGKPIKNSPKYDGDKDMYDTFRNRDPRLYHNVMPPYQVKYQKGDYPTWSFEDNPKYREYLDIMGLNETCSQFGGIGMKRLPAQNWAADCLKSVPNMVEQSEKAFIQSRTGYYFWKNYNNWDINYGNTNSNTSDVPIFKIEEVSLNYAEAMWELGRFDQAVANETINKLRDRAEMATMVVAQIDDNWDPDRDKGGASGYANDYSVDPVLWEIRRERLIELFGEGFAFYDIKRWKKAHYFLNKQAYGMWTSKTNEYSSNNGIFRGTFIDLNTGSPNTNATEGYVYTMSKPKGWKEMYYLEQVPTKERLLNPNLTQNPGYEEEFGM